MGSTKDPAKYETMDRIYMDRQENSLINDTIVIDRGGNIRSGYSRQPLCSSFAGFVGGTG
jgi:hypothetical protein